MYVLTSIIIENKKIKMWFIRDYTGVIFPHFRFRRYNTSFVNSATKRAVNNSFVENTR